MKVFFTFFLIFFTIPVFASHYQAKYVATGLGMDLLTADMMIDMTDTDYAIQTNSVAKGILSLFIHSKTAFYTKGKIQKNKLTVLESLMKNTDGKKTDKTIWNFAEKKDFIDYQSVLIYLMRLQKSGTQTVQVSDGKRDMLVTLTDEGKRNLAQIHPDLSGEGQAYSVRIKITGGKKSGWFFKRIQEEKISPMWLYMQKEENEYSLVLSTFDTGVIGQLYIIRKEFKNEKNQSKN